MPRLHSGAATDRPETTKLPPIPEVVWKQPQEIHLIDKYKNSITNIKRKNAVESRTSPIRETSSHISGSDTESFLGNRTRSMPVKWPIDSKKQQPEIQRKVTDMKTYDSGVDNISPPKIRSQSEERLVRGDITNELYMPLSSTIVLKRKKQMLYVSLDFGNGFKKDALVDSGNDVRARVQKQLDIFKEQAPSRILKIDDPPKFQIQVAIGQSEKSITTSTPEYDIGDLIFAEHFVVLKNLT